MSRRITFLVFGEDQTDCISLTYLIKHICRSEEDVLVSHRRRPLVLSRAAQNSGKRRKMSEEIALLVQFEEKKGHRAVIPVLHRDCDAVEPAHVQEQRALKEDLREYGINVSVCATPAWELETWWMLFPEALSATRPCWNLIGYGARNVGMITNSKEQLRRDLRPKGQKACPDYRESDSIAIAKKILDLRIERNKIVPRCDSFACFADQIEAAVRTE